MNNLNVKISIGDKQIYYTEDYLKQYAQDNKDKLLHTIDDSIIVSNWSGWCTLVNSTFTIIYQAWAGELKLKF